MAILEVERIGAVQLLSHPFASIASIGETGSRGGLRGRLARVLQPQALLDTRSQLAWTAVWTLVVIAIAAADVMAGPRTIGAGALAVLPIMAASWMLGGRQLAVVVAISMAAAVAMTATGVLTPPALGARLLAVFVAGAIGRTAALSTAEVRRARQHEVSTLLHASQLLGRAAGPPAPAAGGGAVAAAAPRPPRPSRR